MKRIIRRYLGEGAANSEQLATLTADLLALLKAFKRTLGSLRRSQTPSMCAASGFACSSFLLKSPRAVQGGQDRQRSTPPPSAGNDYPLTTPKLVGRLGLEPRTNGLKIRCSNRLSYRPDKGPRG